MDITVVSSHGMVLYSIDTIVPMILDLKIAEIFAEGVCVVRWSSAIISVNFERRMTREKDYHIQGLRSLSGVYFGRDSSVGDTVAKRIREGVGRCALFMR